jgi:hypothetical protein
MIDLNPLVEERHPIKPPPNASAEEYHCKWYQLTDKVQYLPGGLYSGRVDYNACFHDLPIGLQTHVFAPLGLNIKGKWTLGGTLPGEPKEAVELGLGVPKDGLWLREDVDMKCNVLMTNFVKKTLKKAHATLVERLVEKAHILEAQAQNNRIIEQRVTSPYLGSAGMVSPGFPSSGYSSPGYPSPGFPSPGFPSPGFPGSGFQNTLPIRPDSPSMTSISTAQSERLSYQGIGVQRMSSNPSYHGVDPYFHGTKQPFQPVDLPSYEPYRSSSPPAKIQNPPKPPKPAAPVELE